MVVGEKRKPSEPTCINDPDTGELITDTEEITKKDDPTTQRKNTYTVRIPGNFFSSDNL